MADGGETNTVSKLTCSICLETFTDPKLLPCFHSFCVNCLEDYSTKTQVNNKFNCPLCRVTIDIPVGGVHAFQSNFYIECGQIPLSDIFCDVCGHDKNANHRCIDCEENFCDVCSNAHMKMKMTRGHTMLELEDDCKGVIKKIKSKSFCSKHNGEEIKIICKDCDELLCIVCKLTEHENHKSVDVAKDADEKRKLLLKFIDKNKDTVETYNKTDQIIEKCKKYITRKFDNDVDKFSKDILSLISDIKDEEQRVKKKMRQLHDEDIHKLTLAQTKVVTQVGSCTSLVDAATAIVEMGRDVDIRRSYTDLMAKLQETPQSIPPVVPRCRYTLMRYKVVDLEQVSKIIDESLERFAVETVNEVKYLDSYHSAKCRSINVCKQAVFVSFLDVCYLHKYTAQDMTEGINEIYVTLQGNCVGITSDDKGNIFFTTLSDKSITKSTFPKGKQSKLQTTDLYPHGIAFRPSDSLHGDEIIVCIIDSPDSISLEPVKGYVKAFPSTGTGNCYNIIDEHCPAPSSVAVNKSNGMICLGYPSDRKVTLLTSGGQLAAMFKGTEDAGSPKRFCPMAVCFDNLNGVVIADYGNDAVIRINAYGEFLQVLIKANQPLAAAIELDNNILWIGCYNKNITRYQLKLQSTSTPTK